MWKSLEITKTVEFAIVFGVIGYLFWGGIGALVGMGSVALGSLYAHLRK